MSLFQLRRIVKEDFPQKYYDLLDKLLFPLNQMVDSLNNGLTNQLTVAQNLSAQQTTITVQAPINNANPVSFKSNLASGCNGIICINAVPVSNTDQPVTGCPFLSFQNTSNNGSQIQITNITNLVSGSNYNLTLYCFT